MIDLGSSCKIRVAPPLGQRLSATNLSSCRLRNAQETNTTRVPSCILFATTLWSLLGLLAGSRWASDPKQVLAQAGGTAGAPVLPAGPEQQVNPSQTPSTGATTSETTAAPLFSRKWFDGVKYGAQFEAGFVFNPQRPRGGLNFGHLFTDRANQVTLNQVLLTVQRVVDPKATGYDFGFIVQGVYGTDARYLHYLGELDHSINTRYQFTPYQANISAHLPWLSIGGIDAKVGQYASPLGFEPLDPSTSPFFSHSYISNFGVTGQHTGLLTTTHVNDTFDLWLGIDSGNGTSLGARSGDNNSQPAGIVGLGLNGLLDGKLTVLALSHLGPELPTRLVSTADKEMRYYNDIVITYKSFETLTFTTELNYVRDTGLRAEASGPFSSDYAVPRASS